MGELKSQDPVISTTEKVKKKPGNPNLGKGKPNPYYKSGNQNTSETKTNMADEAEVVSETKEPVQTPSSDVSGEKKIIPDDIFSDVIPGAEVLPLDGEVKTKDYANLADPNQPNTNSGSGGGGDNKPPITPNTGDLGGGAGTGGTIDPNLPPTSPMGPPVTPEQVKTEAEQFVKLLVRGYEKLHSVARWAAKMDPHDLAMLDQKGKINLDATLALGTGKLPLRDFFKQYNDQIEEDIVVTPEFIADITPPLERIAIKRGWGLGDEGTVGLLLAEDIGTKAALLYGLKKTCNMILESQMLILKNQREAKEAKENPKKEQANASAKDFEADANAWREKDDNIEDAKEV